MADEIIQRYLFPVLVGITTILISYIINLKTQHKIEKQKVKDEKDMNEKMEQAKHEKEEDIRKKIRIYTMQHIIESDYDKYMEAGSWSFTEKHNFHIKLMLYHEIGGNSVVDEMNEKLKNLKITE